MRPRSREPWRWGWVVLALLLIGCGVSPQSGPVPLPVQPSAPRSATRSEPNGYAVTVYFVQFGRLAPVSRPAPDTEPQTALRLLVAGPDAVEVAMGLETALVPQQLSAAASERATLAVDAGAEFTSIAGDNQLLAVAQLVWTATSSAPHSAVRITVAGKPIEVPTDRGLSRLPVGRDDFEAVAPVGDRPQGAGRPTPSATPS